MQNVILVIHLLLALGLIGVVLLQRSEGGGLGIGGGGGVMSARGAATALGKLTWILAITFLATSIGLTILSAKQAADSSVVDRVTQETAPATAPLTPAAPEATPAPETPAATETTPAPAQPAADGGAPRTTDSPGAAGGRGTAP
jgi:preprotein translocase subunit SecG